MELAVPAVIFDVDGVLVDSYQAHLESWRVLARETGVQFEEAAFAATFGRTSRDIIRTFWEKSAGAALRDEDVRRLDDRKESFFRALIERDFPRMEGAIELIDALGAAGFPLAVGSSAPPANIELVLDRLGRRGAFAAIVAGGDVTRGKPDPQVFQMAAQRLGIAPAWCVVIEDAPAGIAAAKAAGMSAVALLSTGRKREDFDGLDCDFIVRSLRELAPDDLASLTSQRGTAKAGAGPGDSRG